MCGMIVQLYVKMTIPVSLITIHYSVSYILLAFHFSRNSVGRRDSDLCPSAKKNRKVCIHPLNNNHNCKRVNTLDPHRYPNRKNQSVLSLVSTYLHALCMSQFVLQHSHWSHSMSTRIRSTRIQCAITSKGGVKL